LGCRMLTCKVGPQEKFFRVHADLMCKTSRVIRNKIQRKRRKIEGDCPICHEELRPEAEDLTFCDASCGRNFHSSCMTGWIQRATAAATCPLCRHDWVQVSDRTLDMTDISERGFEIYVEWLYYAKIPIETDGLDECWKDLIEAYFLGIKLQDLDFCIAILQSIKEVGVDENDFPGPEAVKLAYDKTCEPCPLRYVLVSMYMRSQGGYL
ncbi:hypothetical protein C7974DRAFT_450262, partial [Boeremia exigua]|uniref:uncharacterized protein n=1 Tax=Boeremia exigua TaxID=749465 RepID=UPI001E8E973E